jgi:hypothetical protein
MAFIGAVLCFFGAMSVLVIADFEMPFEHRAHVAAVDDQQLAIRHRCCTGGTLFAVDDSDFAEDLAGMNDVENDFLAGRRQRDPGSRCERVDLPLTNMIRPPRPGTRASSPRRPRRGPRAHSAPVSAFALYALARAPNAQ